MIQPVPEQKSSAMTTVERPTAHRGDRDVKIVASESETVTQLTPHAAAVQVRCFSYLVRNWGLS
jgi:hypothetical protein